MGAWNVLSLREDNHLSLLSSELKHLDIGIASLSEVWRPDCSEIMVGGYTYYWFGRSDGYHLVLAYLQFRVFFLFKAKTHLIL